MKPHNFLYILSEQHQRRASGAYGHPVVQTPHLDALAARGTRFQTAYTKYRKIPKNRKLEPTKLVHNDYLQQASDSGLLTTIAWGLDGKVEYALEGSVFNAGAAVQWLRDEVGLLGHAAESQAIAESVPDTGGVYVVPAFTGLGAPYWDPRARGVIVGLTRGSSRAHLVRATLESIAYQSRDVLACFETDTGLRASELQVDGGATANDFLMQFQADLLGVPVRRPRVLETTALGAAYLAGLGVGFFSSRREIETNWEEERRFEPRIAPEDRERLYQGWLSAVARSRNWLPE